MAKGDPIGDILTLGIVAGGAYLIWNWWVGTAAAAGGVASQQGLPLMSLATFLTALAGQGINTTGLSGLGQARLIPIPVVLPGKTKTTIQLPAGTTPAMLQAQLRAYRASR